MTRYFGETSVAIIGPDRLGDSGRQRYAVLRICLLAWRSPSSRWIQALRPLRLSSLSFFLSVCPTA